MSSSNAVHRRTEPRWRTSAAGGRSTTARGGRRTAECRSRRALHREGRWPESRRRCARGRRRHQSAAKAEANGGEPARCGTCGGVAARAAV
ncbi:hypothetical protein GUJ93_ZPchr0015g6662 [Zizania palustris]|uniref:Uncharacterized protein n=1 Tax=Zizania palustris TaxID=103762 RepID=A0A8J5SYY1_ZIZPA|nr:hypothetical protein GUJ93_ZPchr0015g6662 [Zizania palustris]